MLEITTDNCNKWDLVTIKIQIIVNIFGLTEEIQKLKPNKTGKLFLINVKTYSHIQTWLMRLKIIKLMKYLLKYIKHV